MVGDPTKDKTQSGLVRVFIPGYHSNEFKEDDLPLCSLISSGDQEGQTRFSGGPEPGTMVTLLDGIGFGHTGHKLISGAIKDVKNQNQTLPGNIDIRSFDLIQDAFTRKLPINSKAKAGSGEYKTKPTEEAGGEYFRDLTKAIPTSSTLWQIAGMKIPQSKAVPTGKQDFTAIMPAAAMAGLPGMALNLGNMFSSMPQELLNQVLSAVPPELTETITAMTNLMPENGAAGLEGIRIDPEVFFANAVEILSQCRTTADVMEAIQELLTNTALHGTDSLGTITVPIETPFGNSNVSFTTSGSGSSSSLSDVLQTAEKFASMLTDTSGGFPSVFPDKNMWGVSSKTMGEMMKRLEPKEFSKAVQQAQKSIAPGMQPRELINKAHAMVAKGEDFIKQFLA